MDQTPPLPTPPPTPSPSSGLSERQWAVFLNVSAFAGFIIPTAGNIIGPLIIWLIKKPDSAFLDAAGREVLNFQISFTIYGWIAGVLCSVIIGFFLLPIVGLIWLIFTIIGAVKASDGEEFRFPMTIRML